MEHRPSHTLLGCVDCDFKCCTVNEMSRHIFNTRHGARKCPLCDTYIVPRAFYASLRKLIERRRDRLALEGSSEKTTVPAASASPPAASVTAEGSSPGIVEPLTSIAVVTHAHCVDFPNFRCPEKSDFILPGEPRDYGMQHETPATEARSNNPSSGQLVTQLSGDMVASLPTTQPLRCMDCLNFCPTWTQVTKHIEQSGHTLPICGQCGRRLKCFGPLRPPQHEINTGHCGFYGVFYTRKDYRCDTQASRSVYNCANLFTGLSTLQYKCVCGISFLHPLQLAEHLRRVHHVTSIGDHAVCYHCKMSGPLSTMLSHLQHPCWDTGAGSHITGLLEPAVAAVMNPIALAAVALVKKRRLSRSTTAEGEEEHPQGLDDSGAMTHIIEVPGFSGASFLQYRPLLPPMTNEEVPLVGEAFEIEENAMRSSSATHARIAANPANYVVFYQCRECLFLFTSWDRIIQHMHATGHCHTYCAECGAFLPELLGYSAGDSGSGSRGQYQYARQQQQPQQAPPLLFSTYSPLSPVRSTSLTEHLEHLRRHGDILGFPASPETMEVLVDVNAACYRGSLDPSPDMFAGPRIVMAYQCPDQHKGCYKVFLNYGNLVEHLLASHHGTQPCPSASAEACPHAPSMALHTCYPMVTYRAKFTEPQLCEHFDFVQCVYCEAAVPKEERELHAALCIERRRQNPPHSLSLS